MAGADLCSAADAIDAKLLRQLAPSLYLSGQVGVLLKMNPKGSVNSSTVTIFPESFKRALEGEGACLRRSDETWPQEPADSEGLAIPSPPKVGFETRPYGEVEVRWDAGGYCEAGGALG